MLRRISQWLRRHKQTGPTAPVSALDAACLKHGATYNRQVMPSGEVQMTLTRPAQSLTATHVETQAAVALLLEKARKCWD